MTWNYFFTSSIGKKYIMGLTGLFLISFLVVHCILNGMIFLNDKGEAFNDWAHFMGTNIFIRIMEIGLFAGLIIHTVQGIVLWRNNVNARPIKYAVNDAPSNSKWYSRSMGFLGTLILIFLILHLYHFWTPSRFGGRFGIHKLKEVPFGNTNIHDLYGEMLTVFQNNFAIVAIYVLAMFSLAWHLLHGFQSAFQTFGINHKRYTPIIKGIGAAFSIIVPLIFALMPLAIYFGWVK